MALLANILSISSQVVYGHVGNSAAGFALGLLGHEVWAIPTVLLSHHPGHGRPFGRQTSPEEIVGHVQALEAHGWLAGCDAVMSGYLANAGQADAVREVVARVKRANLRAIFFCDPILGDEDTGSYTAPEIAIVTRELVGLADIISPNLFELGILSAQKPQTTQDAVLLARGLGPQIVAVTTAFAPEGRIASLIVTPDRALRVETTRHFPAQRGTGDVFAGILLGKLLEGADGGTALAHAAGATADMVGASLALGRDELALAQLQHLVVRPDTYPVLEILV